MKNSFYLVTPEQKENKELITSFEKTAVNQWISLLPAKNKIETAQLFYDFVEKFNTVEMPVLHRIDIAEILRHRFLKIKKSLWPRLIKSGFPKGESEKEIFDLLVSIEKKLTISYWVAVQELTHRNVSWLQRKNAALAIQRTIKGLSGIVVSYYTMLLPIPDWIWIDLHSLYKLSVKNKKQNSKVADETNFLGKGTSPKECYIQILLFSLSSPSGLMQKEIQIVIDLITKVSKYVSIDSLPVSSQKIQCVVLVDEDSSPFFSTDDNKIDAPKFYLNLTKLQNALNQSDKYSSEQLTRYGKIDNLTMSSDLLNYITQQLEGTEIKRDLLFTDRLDRYISVGLDATYSLQTLSEKSKETELLAKSFSEKELSCQFPKDGALSIGSLVSYRQTKESNHKRCLGIVKKIIQSKKNETTVFELTQLSQQAIAVSYLNIDTILTNKHQKALLYRVKNKSKERTYILIDSAIYNDGDILRMFMNKKNFPIVLGDKKNIGAGYWQFECRRIEEKQVYQ